MAGRPRVFVSSVHDGYEGLRETAKAVVERMGFEYVGMERFGSLPDQADVTCWHEVARCDLYLGLLGWRYGSRRDGASQSYTEREYHYARLLDLPCYALLAGEARREEELAHPPGRPGQDPLPLRQEAFRQLVRRQ